MNTDQGNANTYFGVVSYKHYKVCSISAQVYRAR